LSLQVVNHNEADGWLQIGPLVVPGTAANAQAVREMSHPGRRWFSLL
jgi:hypothetical protein